MKKISTVFVILCVAFSSQAQIKPLTVGDQMPDLKLDNIVHFKTKSAKISDFRGKLLILDFWATWCGPCVMEFPKLDTLQKKYEKDVIILSVTDQSEKQVSDFLVKEAKRKNMALRPSVTGDTVVRNIFKHGYIPHYAWIDAKGKIIAITSADNVTSENIAKAISGTAFSLPLKQDNLKTLNAMDPLFATIIPAYTKEEDGTYSMHYDSVEQNRVLVQSTFTRYIDGLSSGMSNRINRITCKNQTIERMFTLAFGRFTTDFTYKCVWEVADSSLRMYRDYELWQTNRSVVESNTWRREYAFCYELSVPSSTNRQSNYDLMQRDLNNYFGALFNIEGAVEKRKVKYLALVRTSQNDKIAVKNKEAETEELGGIYEMKVVNLPAKNIVESLRNALQGYFLPMVDETGYTGNVELKIEGDLQKLDVVNAQLAKYDLKFIEKEGVLDVVVIKTKK